MGMCAFVVGSVLKALEAFPRDAVCKSCSFRRSSAGVQLGNFKLSLCNYEIPLSFGSPSNPAVLLLQLPSPLSLFLHISDCLPEGRRRTEKVKKSHRVHVNFLL